MSEHKISHKAMNFVDSREGNLNASKRQTERPTLFLRSSVTGWALQSADNIQGHFQMGKTKKPMA